MRPVISTGLLVAIVFPCITAAQYPNKLLMPSERTAMLAERTNLSVWSKIQYSAASATANQSSFQGNYHTRYLSASLGDRIAIAQIIGEEGVEQYASTRRLRQLLGPRSRSFPRGPDSVYWNRVSGKVQVFEAKGGTSQPKRTFGSLQGTNRNTIRSAKGILHSRGAVMSEKLQAARVIKAAQSGHLETGIIRTPHLPGTPLTPRLIGNIDKGHVAKEAHLIQREVIRRNPGLRTIFFKAGMQHQVSRLSHLGASSMPRFAPVSIPGLTTMPGIFSTGGRALQFGSRYILPVGLGIAGANLAVYGYQYGIGHMARNELIEAIAAPAVLLAFTASGAVVGAMPGAVIGATLALPVQLYLWFSSDSPQQPDYLIPQQQKFLDGALTEFYLSGTLYD